MRAPQPREHEKSPAARKKRLPRCAKKVRVVRTYLLLTTACILSQEYDVLLINNAFTFSANIIHSFCALFGHSDFCF